MLRQLDAKLAAKGVTVTLTDAAREQLLKWGFTKEYGAREMDRVIGNRLKPIRRMVQEKTDASISF